MLRAAQTLEPAVHHHSQPRAQRLAFLHARDPTQCSVNQSVTSAVVFDLGPWSWGLIFGQTRAPQKRHFWPVSLWYTAFLNGLWFYVATFKSSFCAARHPLSGMKNTKLRKSYLKVGNRNKIWYSCEAEFRTHFCTINSDNLRTLTLLISGAASRLNPAIPWVKCN